MKWLAALSLLMLVALTATAGELQAKQISTARSNQEAVAKMTMAKKAGIKKAVPVGRMYKAVSKNKNYTIVLSCRHPTKGVPPDEENWSKLVVLDKAGKKISSVGFAPYSALIGNFDAYWSPDGTYLVYYLVYPEGRQEQCMLDLELGIEISFSPHLITNNNFLEWKKGSPHTAIVQTSDGKAETNPGG